MESSEPLSIESFSNSWLTTAKSPLDELEDSFCRPSLDNFHETTSSEELDYYRTAKKRHPGLDFNFDVPVSQFHDQPLVHADQLFSDGIIKPSVHTNYKSKMEEPSDDSSLVLASDCTVSSIRVLVPSSVVDVQCQILRRWRKSVEEIVQKCCGYLRPLCYKIIGSSKSRRRVGDIRGRQIISSSRSSPQSSPINHFEHSIYEAILHCKRSTDK